MPIAANGGVDTRPTAVASSTSKPTSAGSAVSSSTQSCCWACFAAICCAKSMEFSLGGNCSIFSHRFATSCGTPLRRSPGHSSSTAPIPTRAVRVEQDYCGRGCSGSTARLLLSKEHSLPSLTTTWHGFQYARLHATLGPARACTVVFSKASPTARTCAPQKQIAPTVSPPRRFSSKSPCALKLARTFSTE